MGTKATRAACPDCKKNGKWSWIELTPPYWCKVCGYSMITKRPMNYPNNIVISSWRATAIQGRVLVCKERIEGMKLAG